MLSPRVSCALTLSVVCMSLNLLSLISNRQPLCSRQEMLSNAFVPWTTGVWVGDEKTHLGKSGPRLTVHICLGYNCFINKINLPTFALHYYNI